MPIGVFFPGCLDCCVMTGVNLETVMSQAVGKVYAERSLEIVAADRITVGVIVRDCVQGTGECPCSDRNKQRSALIALLVNDLLAGGNSVSAA